MPEVSQHMQRVHRGLAEQLRFVHRPKFNPDVEFHLHELLRTKRP